VQSLETKKIYSCGRKSMKNKHGDLVRYLKVNAGF